MGRTSRSLLAVLASVASFGAARAAAQPFGPSGGEFVVNTTTAGGRSYPAVGVDLLGRFFVAWLAPDGIGNGVWARRFNHDGSSIDFTEFAVNPATADDAMHPSVAVGRGLGFDSVVSWEAGINLFGRVYDADGWRSTKVVSPDSAIRSASAMDKDGNWVTVWNAGGDIVGQRYDASGNVQGANFTVATSVGGSDVDVARAPGGAFFVVWGQTVGEIFARRYSTSGGPVGSGFQVNTATGNGVYLPHVAANDDDFVVVWKLEAASDPANIRARLFDNGGNGLTPDFRVNEYTTGTQSYPDVGIATDGTFAVVWTDRNDRDGGGPSGGGSIWARRYAADGSPLASEFRVNTITTGQQAQPAIAMQANGDFVVVWGSGSGFSDLDVHAQRYCHKLAGDANGDGAITVGDVFYLINNLFAGGPAPVQSADADGNGATNVLDVFYLINMLFAGGPWPACPLPLF